MLASLLGPPLPERFCHLSFPGRPVSLILKIMNKTLFAWKVRNGLLAVGR